ncbi:mitochondrial f1F0-ATP synthase, subunit f domain-containing protein [Ditylenchus destructor]|uniref:Mitochondrial f1F0-ATP synthase, subunit f domain-containing protein n=1 Tax=Ditylenchus destructor TaxID=166010 RepID=A0AAD4R3E5_9BILA|nr:mitochondrial f1F0-ATP synthase, subunit f domain-containing protein [Ditylenchus destructor]
MSLLPKIPPKGHKMDGWLLNLILAPAGRWTERMGVYFYNRVIHPTNIGLYPPEYNEKVHGPYCHWRYYGKPDTPLMDVKIADLPAWIGRREKTPIAAWNQASRQFMWIKYRWFDPLFTSATQNIARLLLFFSMLLWFWNWEHTRTFVTTPYHWIAVVKLHSPENYWNILKRKDEVRGFRDREEPRTGELIDEYLRNAKDINDSKQVMHLLFSANRWALADRMRNELKAGMTLIVDRYSFSGVTYSMAKDLDRNWVCQPEVGLPRPDLVLFFDVDPDKTSSRDGFGDEVMETSEFQKKVYANVQQIFNDKYWRKINAGNTIENVHANVVAEVKKVFASLGNSEIEDMDLSDFGL